MKTYANYLKNKKLRRENKNVRRIVNGQPKTYWGKQDGQTVV